MKKKNTVETGKDKKSLIVYISLIIISFILLIIGQNNLIGWTIFIALFISLYFCKDVLSEMKRYQVFLVWLVIICVLSTSYAFTRPFPSIRGLMLTLSEIVNANRKGYLSLYNNPKDIDSFIAEQRKTNESVAKKYKVPNDINIIKVSISNTNCEWVSVKNAPNDKIIIYLHGGAYMTGNLDTSRPFAVRISKSSGFKVLVVEYALAPEHPFPVAFNQTIGVYRWLIEQGISPSKIAILGDSAGGGLGVATLLALKENNEALPGALVIISPWLDLTSDSKAHELKPHQGELDWYNQSAKLYAGSESLLNKFVSPMYGDYKGFPPLLIHAGEVDILIHDINKAANKAKLLGVDTNLKVYKGMYHDFTTTGDFIPESKESVRLIAQFIQQHLK